jgi:hypothetical protein
MYETKIFLLMTSRSLGEGVTFHVEGNAKAKVLIKSMAMLERVSKIALKNK